MRYVSTGTLPDLKPLANMAFSFIKKDIDVQIAHSRCGEYHWNWNGGISNENHRIRTSVKYRQWRTFVLRRDKFTCQHCGQRGGKLNAHHIIAFSICPELRFDVNNGITLCKNCHVKLHKIERPWVERVS